jgi:hypothetical protein
MSVVEQSAQWAKLKALVFGQHLFPITKRVYSMAVDEFLASFRQAPRTGLHKGHG